MTTLPKNDYSSLISAISSQLTQARNKAIKQVNTILVETYRNIGMQIVEFEQGGKDKAEYGDQLLKKMSKDLQQKFGRGFSWRNLYHMKLFYTTYPKLQTVSAKFQKINRSHFVKLLTVADEDERSFYEIECWQNNRSVRELRRQIDSSLYERLALSKDKQGVKDLGKKWQMLHSAKDALKDPYLLEFYDCLNMRSTQNLI